jgi:hypothetical protein
MRTAVFSRKQPYVPQAHQCLRASQVLPIDDKKQEVREAAWMVLNLSGLLWLADLAGLLPWDTTPYNSLAEREKRRDERSRAEARGEDEEATKLGRRPRRGRPSSASLPPALTKKQEALRRVLGWTTWDAASELKQKRRQTMAGLKDNLRPRGLERKIIEARPYELERKLIEARPRELERQVCGGAPPCRRAAETPAPGPERRG